MSKKNVITFEKPKTSEKTKAIKIGNDEYTIRCNEYFVNKAIKEIKKIDEDESLDSLDSIFNSLSYLYGADAVEKIAENNLDIDWGSFVRFSISIAAGMTKEEYEASVEEATKNQ